MKKPIKSSTNECPCASESASSSPLSTSFPVREASDRSDFRLLPSPSIPMRHRLYPLILLLRRHQRQRQRHHLARDWSIPPQFPWANCARRHSPRHLLTSSNAPRPTPTRTNLPVIYPPPQDLPHWDKRVPRFG